MENGSRPPAKLAPSSRSAASPPSIRTPDNAQIIVPNSAIYGGTTRNVSAYDTRRNDFVISVSYDDDLSTVKAGLRSVCSSDDQVLADPEVTVAELGDSSVNFVVRPWCATSDYWLLRFDLMRRCKEELEAAGYSMPSPQSDVHFSQAPTRTPLGELQSPSGRSGAGRLTLPVSQPIFRP